MAIESLLSGRDTSDTGLSRKKLVTQYLLAALWQTKGSYNVLDPSWLAKEKNDTQRKRDQHNEMKIENIYVLSSHFILYVK